jgi:DNA replication protein DnaC
MTTDGNWIRETLGAVLERVQREQAAAEEHARTCTDRPCERCGRYLCRRCGAAVDGRKSCDACDLAAHHEALLEPTRTSIPPHFRWAYQVPLAQLQARVQAAPELVRRGLENPPSSGLLFLGPTGSGKTSLAVAMLDAWVRAAPGERTGALFVEATWLSRARARHRLGADEAPLVRAAMTCPLLVLDDLGSEREDRDGCITDVVWTRTNNDLPLWVTSGLASEEQTLEAFAAAIARRYDGGFARRIIETSKRVALGGKS